MKICCVEGCDTNDIKVMYNKIGENYYCNRHYHQLNQYGEIRRIKNKNFIPEGEKCCFCGNNNGRLKYFDSKIYCEKHYDHMRLFGYCKDRTIFDRNEIIKYDDYAEVILYALDQTEKARAIIDIEDIDKISSYKWNLGSHGYAICTVLQKCMGTLIMELEDGEIPDHINRDRLDNRKSNLRIADYSTNGMNRSKLDSNKSGVTGVCWDKNNSKWVATIKKNYVVRNKRFDSFEDAAYQRLLWEKELFGEFAPQKHLFEQYGII
jgi:hypothetical protein